MYDTMAKNTLAPLILRLGLAAIFIFHGMEKIRGEGNELGAAWMGKGEHAQPKIVQMLVAWGELVGGIALAVGFLTRLAAVGIAVIMAGAIANVHGKNGFAMISRNGFVTGLVDPDKPDVSVGPLFDPGTMGYEYNFAILVMCAAVIVLGGGALSADRIMRVRPRNPVSGA